MGWMLVPAVVVYVACRPDHVPVVVDLPLWKVERPSVRETRTVVALISNTVSVPVASEVEEARTVSFSSGNLIHLLHETLVILGALYGHLRIPFRQKKRITGRITISRHCAAGDCR
jgi:hypothetical protein